MVFARANRDYPRHISLFRGVKRPRGLARFWSAFTFGNGATLLCYDLSNVTRAWLLELTQIKDGIVHYKFLRTDYWAFVQYPNLFAQNR